MYYCEKCGILSLPGQGAHKLITKTRKKQYFKDGKLQGEGNEIVTEITVCEPCKSPEETSNGKVHNS